MLKPMLSYKDVFKTNEEIISKAMSSTLIEDDTFLHDSDEIELSNRGSLYTQLLSAYVTDFDIRHTRNRSYKSIFFYSITAVFCLVIVLSVVAVLAISSKPIATVNDLVVALSALATMISSLIVLPKIIADYLFHPDEDNKVTDMVRAMQENDCTTRKLYNTNKTEV